MKARFLLAALVAALVPVMPVFAQQPSAAPAAVQQEFDAFLVKFRAAIKADDVGAVAALAQLPIIGEEGSAPLRREDHPELFAQRTRSCLAAGKFFHDVNAQGKDEFSIFCNKFIFIFSKTENGFLLTDITPDD